MRIVIGAIVVSSLLWGCTGVPLVVGALDPGRFKADEETRALCQKDGGIRVHQKVSLQRGRFPTVIPDDKYRSGWIKQGVIYGKYRYDDSYTYRQVHGYTLYRYRTSIASVEDGALIGEMVYYLRQGEPGLPGITCPENLSNEKLINAVFKQEGELTDPYPACPVGVPEKILLTPNSPARLVKDGVKINLDKQPNNVHWQRGLNCDERTKIDRWYDKTGKNEVGLVGTRLLFFGPSGSRCQTLAMPDSSQISCDENGINVLGFKRKAGSATFLVQQFSSTGELLREIEINDVAPFSGALVSYRETETSIKVNTANLNHSGIAKCYSVSVTKPNGTTEARSKRIGPPDRTLGFSECDTD